MTVAGGRNDGTWILRFAYYNRSVTQNDKGLRLGRRGRLVLKSRSLCFQNADNKTMAELKAIYGQ
jgi:hypothetical protein